MKEIRWELILMPLVSIVLGIYLIMQPGAATVALCSLIGWLILLAGAAGAVNALIDEHVHGHAGIHQRGVSHADLHLVEQQFLTKGPL